MSTVAELLIKLGMDDGGLDKGMSSSQSKLKSWGESLRSVGTKLTAGVTLPLVGAGVAALNWASDQQEASNKVDSVFKDSSQGVKDWADDQSNTLLITKGAALDYVGTLGNMLTAQGLTTESAAELSEGWVGLAQDMSSFNNVPVDQALTAIRAGIVGEYEPLRSLGVVLDDATVKQKAMEMGLYDGTGALTGQARALAVNELLLEQTKNVQGDAAKTANKFANQMRILKSNFKDMAAEIGTRFLPYAERFQRWLLDLMDAFDNLDPMWQNVILAIAGIAAAIGPLLLALGFMLPAISALGVAFGILLSPIGLLIVAIGALIALGIYAWVNDLWGMRDAMSAVGEAILTFVGHLDTLRKYLQFVWEDGDKLNDWLTHFPDWLQPAIMGLGDFVNALHDFTDALGPIAGDFYDAFQALTEGDWDEVLYELRDAVLGLGAALSTLGSDTVGLLADGLQNLADKAGVMGPALDLLAESTQNISQGLGYLADAFNQLLAGDYSGAILSLANAFADLAVGALQAQMAVVQAIIDIGVAILENLINSDWVQSLVQKGQDLIQGILAGIAIGWPFFQAWAMGLPAAILDSISDMTTTLLQKGSDLLQGLLDGAAAKWPVIQAWLALTGNAAFAAVGSVLSSLKQKGLDLLQGLLDGLNEKWNTVKAWLSLIGSVAFAAVGSLASTLTSKGSDLIGGLWTGATQKWMAAQSWLSTIASSASGAVGDLGGILVAAGAALMNGLWDGAKGVWESLAGWLSEKKAEIAELKGPEREDAKVLIDNGRAIMRGFGVGLSDGWAGIENQLGDYTAGLSGMMNAGAVGPSSGMGGTVINNYYSIKSEELTDLIRNAENGGDFARSFGAQLGLYTGQP